MQFRVEKSVGLSGAERATQQSIDRAKNNLNWMRQNYHKVVDWLQRIYWVAQHAILLYFLPYEISSLFAFLSFFLISLPVNIFHILYYYNYTNDDETRSLPIFQL